MANKLLPDALKAAVHGIGLDGILVLGKVAHKKIAETSLHKGYGKCGPAFQETKYNDLTICTGSSPFPRNIDDEKCLFDCSAMLTEGVPQAIPNIIAIKESATDGLGIFAARDIAHSELLFAERPLLVCPTVQPSSFYPGEGYTREDLLKRMSFEREQKLESALNRMNDDKKAAYIALSNSIKESGALSGIQETNYFGLDLNKLTRNGGVVLESDELHDVAEKIELSPQEENIYAFTAKTASRMNHSCSPNAEFAFSLGSFSFQFHAMRDIKAGEEIFVSYINEYASVSERREQLESRGFTCACTACSRATPDSDKFRQTSVSEMKKLDAHYLSHSEGVQQWDLLGYLARRP